MTDKEQLAALLKRIDAAVQVATIVALNSTETLVKSTNEGVKDVQQVFDLRVVLQADPAKAVAATTVSAAPAVK